MREPETESSPPGAPAGIADLVFRQASEAIIVTDAGILVTAWNPAAEQTYGIPVGDALGRPLDDLLAAGTTDGTLIGGEVLEALRREGRWQRRIIQRPLLGGREDDQIIVDTVITALYAADGTYDGAVSFNRDVTATARLQAELTTLGSLAVATGQARSRAEIAESGLEVLCRAAQADAGLILSFDETYEITARVGLSDATAAVILAYGEIGRRLKHVLESADAAVSIALDEAPIADDIREAIRADGIAHLAFAGMRVSGRLVGVLGLGWRKPTISSPSGPVLLQAAALVASALENAQLIGQVAHGLELERSLTARLQTLVELTRLPDDAADQGTIAQYLLERIVSVLGAVAGSVVQVEGQTLRTLASHEMPPALERLQATRSPAEWGFHRRFASGSRAYV
ncbi:MAG TPA: PAS domain-containing protein, partial [Candidatus Limnocylindrales bacterium]|nr:PAS domain-containing protein [Candidatus Limnocylindrales bacterium]